MLETDLEAILSRLSKTEVSDFASATPHLASALACYQTCADLVAELKVRECLLACVARDKKNFSHQHAQSNSLFTADARNLRMQRLWEEHLSEESPRAVCRQLSASVVRSFRLSWQRSVQVPSARFPSWLLAPLTHELELLLRADLLDFVVALRQERSSRNASASVVPRVRGREALGLFVLFSCDTGFAGGIPSSQTTRRVRRSLGGRE